MATPGTVSAAYVRLQLGGQTVDVWDTAGSEKFASIMEMYTRNASCIILVFDQTSVESFRRAQTLYGTLKPETNVVLVQNKTDLKDRECVPDSEVEQFVQEHKLILFKTSALTGENVREMFERAAEFEFSNQDDSNDDIVPDEPKKKGRCCE